MDSSTTEMDKNKTTLQHKNSQNVEEGKKFIICAACSLTDFWVQDKIHGRPHLLLYIEWDANAKAGSTDGKMFMLEALSVHG